MVSMNFQHAWAWAFTVIVIACAGVGLAIYMHHTNYISRRRMWRETKKETDK